MPFLLKLNVKLFHHACTFEVRNIESEAVSEVAVAGGLPKLFDSDLIAVQKHLDSVAVVTFAQNRAVVPNRTYFIKSPANRSWCAVKRKSRTQDRLSMNFQA